MRLKPAGKRLTEPVTLPVALPYDVDVISRDANRKDGAFDDRGRTLPAEVLGRAITSEGIEFLIGPETDGEANAVACRGSAVARSTGLLATARGPFSSTSCRGPHRPSPKTRSAPSS